MRYAYQHIIFGNYADKTEDYDSARKFKPTAWFGEKPPNSTEDCK
jgi:hypothetical protein